MAQINIGTVRVENLSSTVNSVWTASLTGITGSFSSLGTIRWGPDTAGASTDTGSGTSLAYDSAAKQLKFYRTTDLAPVVGQIIYIDASNYATIDSFATGSPPHWDKLLAGISGEKDFNVATDVARASVSASTSDTLTLDEPWYGRTSAGTTYSINTDFTDNISLPFLNAGDTNPSASVTRALIEIDRRLKFNGALLSMSADQALDATPVQGTGQLATFLTTDYDTAGFVHAPTDGFFTIPGGIAKVRMAFSAWIDSYTTGAEVELSIVKNGSTANLYAGRAWSWNIQPSATTQEVPFAASTPAIAVAEGDTFQVHIELGLDTEDAQLKDSSQTWFAIEAVELD